MKKLLLLLLVITALQTNKAQTLTEGSPALVYALPKTELNFEVIVEKVVEKPGVFYLYSERFLATDKVIVEEKTSYQVKSIKMMSRPMPDITRRYSYLPTEKSVLKNLVVNEQGILCGVNIPSEKKAVDVKRLQPPSSYIIPSTMISKDILPLTQEYMMAGSTAKLAEGAAKQIYDLRASRISLLTGEMDQLPKDGEALKMMLSGLDRQEKTLSELFVGSRTTEITTHYLPVIPEAAKQDEVFFRLSEKRGLVDKDDMGGAPYFITIAPDDLQVQAANPKAKSVKVGLYTILPAQTTIKITDGIKTLLEKSILMPQFGALIPLPEDLFKSPKVSVKVDVATGRLLSIEE